jgi:hypothetical protein
MRAKYQEIQDRQQLIIKFFQLDDQKDALQQQYVQAAQGAQGANSQAALRNAHKNSPPPPTRAKPDEAPAPAKPEPKPAAAPDPKVVRKPEKKQ